MTVNGIAAVLLGLLAVVALWRLFVFFKKRPRCHPVVYKKTDQGSLELQLYVPRHTPAENRPAMLYFFGGGWVEGRVTQFQRQARYMARAGLLVVCADYRVSSRHGTTPAEAVEDGVDAYLWLQKNAKTYGVDPKKIAVSGGSAGGHIACCVANDLLPSRSIKTAQRAPLMLLLNPVLDLYSACPELEFSCGEMALIEKLEQMDLKQTLSPQQQLGDESPPAYLLYGSEDPLKIQGQQFSASMREKGISVESRLALSQRHGFFNQPPWREWVADDMLGYLMDQGWLDETSSLNCSRRRFISSI